MKFHEDDEGIAVEIQLDSFNKNLVQFIYLEAQSTDEKFINEIVFFLSNQDNLFQKSKEAMSLYVKGIYNLDLSEFELMKVYISPELKFEYGLLFRWTGDPEHGIGIKFSKRELTDIGSGEVSFL